MPRAGFLRLHMRVTLHAYYTCAVRLFSTAHTVFGGWTGRRTLRALPASRTCTHCTTYTSATTTHKQHNAGKHRQRIYTCLRGSRLRTQFCSTIRTRLHYTHHWFKHSTAFTHTRLFWFATAYTAAAPGFAAPTTTFTFLRQRVQIPHHAAPRYHNVLWVFYRVCTTTYPRLTARKARAAPRLRTTTDPPPTPFA